jgi:SAM-dependent methyltransferase
MQPFTFNFFSPTESSVSGIVPIHEFPASDERNFVLNEIPYPNNKSNEFKYRECATNHFKFLVTSSSLQLADIPANCDIVHGKYEGGLQIWECSKDLVDFIHSGLDDIIFPTTSVLELGCGHGLPCLAAMKKYDARSFVFSDFNKEVLETITWPNIIANTPIELHSRVKCVSGDWDLLVNSYLSSGLDFGLILSAETLYTEECTKKVFSALSNLLCEGGVAVLSNKRYYFGVGGGVGLFEEMITKSPRLQIVSKNSVEDGASNVRDILVITTKGRG